MSNQFLVAATETPADMIDLLIQQNADLTTRVAALEAFAGGMAINQAKILLGENAIIPSRSTPGAAAYDLFARAIVDPTVKVTPEEPWRPNIADFMLTRGWQNRLGPGIEQTQIKRHPEINNQYKVIVEPGVSFNIGPGFVLEIPEPAYLDIAGRSGLTNSRFDVTSGRIIDPDYRAEVTVRLTNNGKETQYIFLGMRFAQMVISRALTPELILVSNPSDLSRTNRGGGGLGSTGK